MAKKISEQEINELQSMLEKTKIQKRDVEYEMKHSFIAYAMAVNVSRAIPDVRDGLKPVHRRILYAMGNDLGLYAEKPHRKCARIVGEVLGKYHPHGDTAVYDALVRLAQDFSIRCPLVDGHGNFGSVDGDPAAAQRYTEARLSKIASEMLRDMDKQTVDFYPNFDETCEQPVVLPARFPNLLVNGSDGIAVGMATNIPPHNLVEVINGAVALLDNPDITVEELMEIIPGPDFPTGGVIMGRSGIRSAYQTGRGSIVLRAKTEIEEFNNGTRQRIVATELPYQVNKAKLIERIADLVKEKRIEGISDVRDESDREGLRLVVEIKKDANAQVVLNQLYKHTNLQVGIGVIMLALVDREPKVLSLRDVLYQYIRHQREVIERRTRYDLAKAEERAHIVKGLVIALANIDEVISVIKTSQDRNVAAAALMERFELSPEQANAILDMRLARLTSLEVEKLQEELTELERLIADYKDILANPARIDAIIREEIIEIRDKYGAERKTEISMDFGDIDLADLVPPEDVVISMTNSGYIKRTPTAEYHAQRRGGRGVTAHKPKEEDFVDTMFVTNTHHEIMFFTNLGKVYRIKGYEIPEAARAARGRAIVNILQLDSGEKVTAVIPVAERTEGFLVMATKKGLIKKTALSEFESIRKVGKLAIRLVEDDELIAVAMTDGTASIIMASAEGKCIRFAEADVRETGRDTQGVRSIRLSDEDKLVDMLALREGTDILTITENGFGKRSSPEDYREQNRGGKGIKAGVFNEKTGRLVCLKQVTEEDDIMLIADNGTIIRIPADNISRIGRDTKGVRIMKMVGDAKVVSVAIAEKEEELELPEEGAPELSDGAETPEAAE